MNLSVCITTLLFTQLTMSILPMPTQNINYNNNKYLMNFFNNNVFFRHKIINNNKKFYDIFISNNTSLIKKQQYNQNINQDLLNNKKINIKKIILNKLHQKRNAAINNKKNLTLVSVVVIVDNKNTTLLFGKNINKTLKLILPIKRHYSLVLAIIPMLTVFGNALVIMAVYRERSLQTVTNLLIVSLAVSDFMVRFIIL